MLGSELEFDLGSRILRNLGKAPAVQDPNCRDRAHDGNFGIGPGEDARCPKRGGVHRNIGAAV